MKQHLLKAASIAFMTNFLCLADAQAQSNLLPGMIYSGPAYSFIDEDIFDELPKAAAAAEKNSRAIDESFAANTITVKASKIFVDFNQNPNVEFSAIAPWATDYLWKFGDGSVLSGVQNATHTFKQPGNYRVSVAASNDHQIQNEIIEIKVIDNQHGIKLEEMGHYVVFPTGNKLETEIQLNLPTRERKLYVELQDISGEHVTEQLVGKVRKKQRIKLDFGEIPEGKYYAVLKGKKFSMISKITVIRN
jgi:hypothetical protein